MLFVVAIVVVDTILFLLIQFIATPSLHFLFYITHYAYPRVVFYNSAFKRTLCGGAWSALAGDNNAFASPGSSKAQHGCCAPGSFMRDSTFFPFSQSTACQGCPAGQFGVDTNDDSVETACNEQCAIGKYSDQTGLSAGNQCKDCSTGKFSNQTGLTSDNQCTKCAAGQFSNLLGLSSNAQCTGRCALGKYSKELGLSSDNQCKACPTGQYTDQLGRTECETCTITGYVCPEGSTSPNLTVCTVGTYSDEPETSPTCKVCSAGKKNSTCRHKYSVALIRC
jgi:hypothetical protein